jgi:uncharacterized protein
LPVEAQPIRVVIVSDGKRGHENQSRVLARMLGDSEPLMMLLRKGQAEWPLRLRFALAGDSWLSQEAAAILVKRMLLPENAEQFRAFAEQAKAERGQLRYFTVSTGTPPATLNLVLKRMLGAQTIVNMTPSLLPRKLFELNIVPEHDLSWQQLRHLPVNVIAEPLALGYHDVTSAQHLASRLRAECGLKPGQRYIGLAIGGPSKACRWPDRRVLLLLQRLLEYSQQANAQLLVTTSRRTPPWCAAWLYQHYVGQPAVVYFLDASKDPLNPLPAFYELCGNIFVTEDSYSMVCEAIQAGHQPQLLAVGNVTQATKIGRAYHALQQRSLLRPSSVTLAAGAPTLSFSARQLPNAEYELLRARIRAKLGLT